jgi:hypothetical protein
MFSSVTQRPAPKGVLSAGRPNILDHISQWSTRTALLLLVTLPVFAAEPIPGEVSCDKGIDSGPKVTRNPGEKRRSEHAGHTSKAKRGNILLHCL